MSLHDGVRPDSAFPEGEALVDQIEGRHRRGLVWRLLFQVSTIVGIIALTALLYNILNQAFGLTAVENKVDPAAVVLGVEEARMLMAPDTLTSEDDAELAALIAADPNAIGFFGYAYFQANEAALRILPVDGVGPVDEAAENGRYPLARPLFLYTTPELLRQKPQVAAFINYYLTHVDEEIDAVGYFANSDEAKAAATAAYLAALGLEGEAFSPVDPGQVTGDLVIAGSSTIHPLTLRMVERFVAAGFTGNITLTSDGSTAGFRRFCLDLSGDIVGASRPINQAELAACRANGRQRPLDIRVGTDRLAVVVSQANEFVEGVTEAQLRQIFTTADTWAEVDDSWPASPIARRIPGSDSGTLDFFAETVFDRQLEELDKETLVEILAANISRGLGRRLEQDQRFFDDRLVFESEARFAEACRRPEPAAACGLPARSQQNVYQLVLERVVQPNVVRTWSLVDSIFRRADILVEAQQEFPNAQVVFRSWLTPSFVTSPQSNEPELAGVRTAVLGSLWVIAITVLFSFPIGVGAAIYLEEYARDNRLNRIIQTNINNLAGVPSIIYGMLGLAIFVRVLQPLTSGATFGAVADATTANGRTILSAGLTLGLLILPLIIINAQEAIRAVPASLRQASFGLGATKWQTIWHHVLPNAIPGILTGTILAMSRAIGETAPLVVVGASTFITVDPDGPFAKFTTLPIQIYQWTSRPQAEFRNIAAAAIIVLLVMLLTLNASAVLLRNRFSKRLI